MTCVETPYLFVYGTLRRGADGAMGWAERARLAAESDIVGAAQVRGRLYDLGDYPGLARAVVSADVVHGELVRLKRPRATFRWLDAYEAVGPQFAEPEYDRDVLSVWPAGRGRSLRAWTYVLRIRPRVSRRIADGVWRGRARHGCAKSATGHM